MKILFTILFAFLFANASYSQHKGTINTESKKFARDTIIWKKDSLLTPDNFKSRGGNGRNAGLTASAIFLHTGVYDPSVFYVEAIFMKSKSYIKENAPYVLKHEQLHFDITELYARKLRQMIHETDFKKIKNVSSEIQKLYNKVESEANKEQNKYDNDTEHGMNAAKQQVWSEDIARQLESMDEYNATEVHVVN